MQNKSLNQIKFLASIFVVLIHTSAFRYVNKTGYVFDFIVDTISRFGVPIFFSISGYFLYSKYKTGGTSYWLNYVKKILWLHLWVGMIYLAVTFFDVKIKGGIIPPSFFNLKHQFNSFLYGGLHFHLWYLSALAFAITVLFFASKVKLEKPLFFISLILNIAGTFGNTEIYAPLGHIGFPSRNGLFFALPYVMMGYYIAQKDLAEKIKWEKNKLFKIILFFIILQIIERSGAVLLLGSSQGSNFFIMTLPLVFFILILCLKEKDLFPKLNKYSDKSLNIYLWHPMAMFFWTNILRNFMKPESFIFSVIFTPLVILSVMYFPTFKKNR